jgi:hypothetical protein
MFSSDRKDELTSPFTDRSEPAIEARWIVEGMQTFYHAIYVLRGALTEELSRELLGQLTKEPLPLHHAELVVSDGTKIFCHSVSLQRLAARGLYVSVATSIRILALTINPFTPEYICTPQRLLDALDRELPTEHPPILDVISGIGA